MKPDPLLVDTLRFIAERYNFVLLSDLKKALAAGGFHPTPSELDAALKEIGWVRAGKPLSPQESP